MNHVDLPGIASTETRTRCEGTDCRTSDSARLAGHRMRLCPDCLRLLVTRLRELPGLHEDLADALGGALGARGDDPRERTSGGPVPSGLPFNAAAADVRADIVTTLSSWCGVVVEQRRVPTPLRTVGSLAALLVRHAPWLAAHPAAADFTREVARLVRAARRVAHHEAPRRVTVGRCVAPGCAGRLSTELGDRARIQCDTDPAHSWPGGRWTELRRAMRDTEAARDRWLSAADVARLWSTSTGTVYRLASEQRWRRRTRAGRTYYAETDVHAHFSRRGGSGI
ncbi:hypothetical protein ACIPSE_32985 [Streptomyces sp. NPDC090106]|uniref:hypothetical protein n=1 Tax=Streptomyces sp. NPDC090106 TaxID=3365946 RepID=UPI0038227E88